MVQLETAGLDEKEFVLIKNALANQGFFPSSVTVTILANATSGLTAHGLTGIPKCGKPNPNRLDGASATAMASADGTNVTVTTEVPVSADTVFTVILVI